MKPLLTFETKQVRSSTIQESSLPNLLEGKILQNEIIFNLDQYAEIFEGYGTRSTSYPYRQQNCYTRTLKAKSTKIAVLENDYLRAEFLTELGGRLWELVDKTTGKNLLYTNDVIRFSNLATCNAWFSGGVEWNIGVIGHSSYTCKPVHCAKLESSEGWPILRIYEYERVRGVYYQIDFWLRPDSRSLNCRMQIVNDNDHVVPMYWWSNIAAPEYKNGSIVSPADKAYTYSQSTDGQGNVSKVDVPVVDGIDISHYEDIPKQVDYFFELAEGEPKYIANVNDEGYGLLHLSTSKLISRKLFSWGNNQGSDNWQQFLTEDAGRYVELQAGIGKTQYGCVPMAPHTTWEWMEQYGAIQLSQSTDNTAKRKQASQIAREQLNLENIEQILIDTRDMAKTHGEVVEKGNEYSAFCAWLHPQDKPRGGGSHLDFGVCEGAFVLWKDFVETGILHCPQPTSAPDALFCEAAVIRRLKETIKTENSSNWYAHYQLGIMLLSEGEDEEALHILEKSLDLSESPWALHALACIYLKQGKTEKAVEHIAKGCTLRKDDLSYVKETINVLFIAEAYKVFLDLYKTLPPHIICDSRVRYSYLTALHQLGQNKEAFALFNENGGLIPDDIREGDDEMERMWEDMHQSLYGTYKRAPDQFRFRSL